MTNFKLEVIVGILTNGSLDVESHGPGFHSIVGANAGPDHWDRPLVHVVVAELGVDDERREIVKVVETAYYALVYLNGERWELEAFKR